LSSRIIRNLMVERTFTKIPHALRAEYLDEDDDFRPKEIIVYAPGYNIGERDVVPGDPLQPLYQCRQGHGPRRV
jgi:hypothetical protein